MNALVHGSQIQPLVCGERSQPRVDVDRARAAVLNPRAYLLVETAEENTLFTPHCRQGGGIVLCVLDAHRPGNLFTTA